MRPIGRTRWTVSAGWIPLRGTGPEPLFTSHDRVSILNAGDVMANVEMTLFYTDRDPVPGYRLTVAPRRLRTARLNDLIFPYAIPLEQPYAVVIDSDIAIVVQFTRQDTRQRESAILSTIAFAADD
jgi:hypothetical protein